MSATNRRTQAETVDEYLAEVPEDARRVLQGIREAIKDAAPDATEAISYRIPLYSLRGKHLVGFRASKNHLSLFTTDSAVLRKYQRELSRFDLTGTKTTIRFSQRRRATPEGPGEEDRQGPRERAR